MNDDLGRRDPYYESLLQTSPLGNGPQSRLL